MPSSLRLWRRVIPVAATAAVLLPVIWMWAASLLPASYSVSGMGAGHAMMGGTSVSRLIADPNRRADVVVDLVARQQPITIGGRKVSGYTLNGTSPGPLITAIEGQLIEVHLHNASVAGGVTLHWHGVDVPNADDGVAGVTQDAVPIGGDYTYRFVADHAGTYWYHSHQLSHDQVPGGLFGPLVIKEAPSDRTRPDHPDHDVTAVAHTYEGIRTINGRAGDQRVTAEPGDSVRLRVINTDNGPMQVWSTIGYRIRAVDGRDLHGPTMITGRALSVPAGGRADLDLTVPPDGAGRIQLGAATSMIIGTGSAPRIRQPAATVDLLSYGTPTALPFDPTRPDRRFEYSIGRRPGFVNGKPGLYWTINGHLYPNVPMYMVSEGDVVQMIISNHSGEVHPMHLHGHHAVVLSRNGVPSRGSPWWVDSLDVRDGESYLIAFRADNPGIWMDHCHNLQHAAQGMVAHLMYEGVSTPYVIKGPNDNDPE